MFVGFSNTLFRMGKFRIGAGFRLKKSTAVFVLFFYAMFYLMWYSVLLSGWIIYGTCWLFFYLPYKGISKLVKNSKKTASVAANTNTK